MEIAFARIRRGMKRFDPAEIKDPDRHLHSVARGVKKLRETMEFMRRARRKPRKAEAG